MKINYRWTIRLCVATPILLFLAIFIVGGGHGSYIPAITFFPFAMLGIEYNLESDILLIALAIVQFLIYGITLDVSKARGKFKLAFIALAFVHIAAALCSAILFAKRL